MVIIEREPKEIEWQIKSVELLEYRELTNDPNFSLGAIPIENGKPTLVPERYVGVLDIPTGVYLVVLKPQEAKEE